MSRSQAAIRFQLGAIGDANVRRHSRVRKHHGVPTQAQLDAEADTGAAVTRTKLNANIPNIPTGPQAN